MNKALSKCESTNGTEVSNRPEDVDIAAIGNVLTGNVTGKEIVYPRILIIQSGTPDAGSQGIEIGGFIDNIERRPLHYLDSESNPVMPVVVVAKLPNEFTKWKTKDEMKSDPEGSKIHWKTLDPTDKRVVEGTWPVWKGRGAPPVTESANYLVQPLTKSGNTLVSNGNFAIMSFNRTSYKAGTSFTTKIMANYAAGVMPFDTVMLMRTEAKQYTLEDGTKSNQRVYRFDEGPSIKGSTAMATIRKSCISIARMLGNPGPDNTPYRESPGYKLQEQILDVSDDGQDSGEEAVGDNSDLDSDLKEFLGGDQEGDRSGNPGVQTQNQNEDLTIDSQNDGETIDAPQGGEEEIDINF